MLNQKWILKKLWKDSYFTPGNFEDSFEMYRCGISSSLLGTIIDGYSAEPVWNRDAPLSHTNTLFKHLKTFSDRVGGSSFIYIADPDNVFSIIEWEKVLQHDWSWEQQLEEFELNPAIEGGVSYLVCAFKDQQSVVVFEKDSEEFMIHFYGTKEAKCQFLEIVNP